MMGRVKFLQAGAYNMEGGGVAPLTPTSFSCLDTRKGCEKKIKASGMPVNLAGYLIFSLFIFRFLLSRVGAYCIRPTKRPGRGDLIYLWVGVFIPAGYIWGVFFCALPYRQEIFLS